MLTTIVKDCPDLQMQLQAKTPDETSPRQMTVWEPIAGHTDDSFDAARYSPICQPEATKASKEAAKKEGKTGFFKVKHGFIVHLGDQVKLRYVKHWQHTLSRY